MVIFYARVSSDDQNLARQLKMAEDIKAEKIYKEKITGKNTNRPEFKSMMSFCREGDTIYVESISRLARSTRDLLNIIDELQNKNVEFVSLKESIDTHTPAGRFMLTVFGALAELEREQILERQKEGIELAKKQGKYKGKQKIKVDILMFETTYKMWKNEEITAREAMRRLDLKPNTFYRRVKEYEESKKAS